MLLLWLFETGLTVEITDIIESLITEGLLCIWNFSNNFLGQSTSKWMQGRRLILGSILKVPNKKNRKNGIIRVLKNMLS